MVCVLRLSHTNVTVGTCDNRPSNSGHFHCPVRLGLVGTRRSLSPTGQGSVNMKMFAVPARSYS